MIKKVLSLVLVFNMICTTLCMTVSYASVPVTEESLEIAFQEFVNSNSNENNVKIKIANNVISANSDEGNYFITYDLTNNPIFSYTADIKQGMSYDEFKEKTDNLSAPMLGYLAVANIQGVDYQDSMLYFTMHLMANVLSGSSSLELYGIIDDRNLSEGVSIIKDPNDTETIYASEFGNHAMEYVQKVYGTSQRFNDDAGGHGLNSFEWTQELKDVTDTSCKIVSTVTVNLNADFSQLIGVTEGFAETLANSFNNNDDKPAKPELTDITDTKYEKSVNKLVELGVINGFEDNTFRPAENVTRAQFAKMLVEALDLKLNNSSTSLRFPDLAGTHWAYDYIKIAVDNGIINGYPDGTFKPDNPVTYAESMAMILRAMKLEETMNDKSWPLGYINEAKTVGLLDFVDYNDPNISANRGETAISLFNMISIIEEKEDRILNATYSNEKGTITLKKNGNDGVDFDFSGSEGYTGVTLDYSNGIASKEDDFFDEHYKITAIIDYNQITVEAFSDDPNSNFNNMSGTYYLQAN